MLVWISLRRPGLANRAYDPLRNSLSTLNAIQGHYLLRSAHKQSHVRFSSVRYNSTSATDAKKADRTSASGKPEPSSTNSLKSSGAATTDVTEKNCNNFNTIQKKAEAPKQPILTRAWVKIKHEANHYWDGTKLLASEIKISARLLRRTLQGKALTRRERRQVRRNLCILY